MAGGLLELVAHGVQDIFLIGNPQISFFKVVYKRHTNFSMESILATFDGDINFGNKISAKIPRSGDLAYSMVLEVDLPLLESTRSGLTGGGTISYVNNIGHALIDYVEKQYGEWMEIWTQLSLDESMKFGYQEMLQRYDTFQTTSGPQTVFIPLQFWFCRNIGLALPLVALQYHEVKVNIKFRPLSKLFTFGSNNYYTGSKSGTTVTITSNNPEFASSDNGKKIYWSDGTSDTISSYSSSTEVEVSGSGTKTSQEFYIAPNDTLSGSPTISDARLFVDYIFLDTYERRQFAQMKHRYLIEQVQFNERLIQPFQKHRRVPNDFIYMYSFSLKPENHQPSGACNFSKIDSADLNLTFNSGTKAGSIRVYALSYNILRIFSGMGNVAFSN
jgi:hypothetical protein